MPKENFAVEGQVLPFHRIMFEITRRCNLRCAHCFRGDPQSVDISEEIIDRSLDQISSCLSFDVTGGEPFLVPDKLEYLVDGIIKRKMRFTSFSLVVNGTILDERAQRSVAAINRLATYLYEGIYPQAWASVGKEFDFEKEVPEEDIRISISVSVDEFHHNNPDEAVAYYKKLTNKYVEVKRQDEWKKTDNDGNIRTQVDIRVDKVKEHGTWCDCEGRAQGNHMGYSINTCDFCNLACHKAEFDEKSRLKCNVQICANGNVTFGEQLSFDSEDKFTMGNILEEPLSCIIWKNTFNQPLQCVEVNQLLNIKTKLEHGEVPENEIKPNEAIIEMLKMKRDLMRVAHEKFPQLTYGELLEACDADLNIQTDGWYAFVMSKIFDFYRDKYKDWTYDRDTEQKICNRYIGENALREFTDSVSEILENAKKKYPLTFSNLRSIL